MTYVFDTSAFIQAWVRSYPPDSFPQLWEKIDGLVDAGQLIAPEEVLEELRVQDDDLHAWVKARRERIIRTTSRAIMLEARAVLLDHPKLTKGGTGRSPADPFVIALAALSSCPLVTQELGGSPSKPRIPYVCGTRGIGCMTVLEVIRAEHWSF
jgi:hypothetical protein